MRILRWFKYIFNFKHFNEYYKQKYGKEPQQSESSNSILLEINQLKNEIKTLTKSNEKDTMNLKESQTTLFKNFKEIQNKNTKSFENIQKTSNTYFAESQKTTIKRMEQFQNEKMTNLKKNQETSNTNFAESQKTTIKRMEQFQNEKMVHLEKIQEASFSNIQNISKTIEGKIDNTATTLTKINSMFSNNKTVGSFGETALETILGNALGNSNSKDSSWKKQLTFKNKNIVDFAIKHPALNLYIPIDSKFPIHDIEELQNSKNNEQDKMLKKNKEAKLKKQIKDSIQNMAKDIGKKYVRGVEETTSFGFMFIPSETVYYYVLSNIPEVISFAEKEKVLLCSPITLLSIINVYMTATNDLVLKKNIDKIIKLIEAIQALYKTFDDRWIKYKKDNDKMQKDIRDLDTTFGKINTKYKNILKTENKKEIETVNPE